MCSNRTGMFLVHSHPPPSPSFVHNFRYVYELILRWFARCCPWCVCLGRPHSLCLSCSTGFVLTQAQDRLDCFNVSLVRNFFFKFSSFIPFCLSHLCFKRHSKVSGHQMFRPFGIVCNPLPLNLIFYLKNKFQSSWLWTKFSLHEVSEIKCGVIYSSSEEMRNTLPKAFESLGLKIHSFISVLVMNKNAFGCSKRRQQISFAMEVGHCWGWQSRCRMTGRKRRKQGRYNGGLKAMFSHCHAKCVVNK